LCGKTSSLDIARRQTVIYFENRFMKNLEIFGSVREQIVAFRSAWKQLRDMMPPMQWLFVCTVWLLSLWLLSLIASVIGETP
jgi:hypothetical protein